MAAGFQTTHWSVILSASGQGEDARAALERLCQAYWQPVYSFVRARRGGGHADAIDLTQEFFTRLLERNDLARADPSRGRFRSWLLCCLKNFLANEWDYQTASCRDQRKRVWSDAGEGDEWLASLARHNLHPERAYHRTWVHALLERTMAKLAERCDAKGKGVLFAQTKHLLVGPAGEQPEYAPIARALGVRAETLKVEVHRLRQQFGSLLRAEVAELVDAPDDIDSEIAGLLAALSDGADER